MPLNVCLISDRAPVTLETHDLEMHDDDLLYTGEITHNLNRMADAAGLYHALWRPDEQDYTQARQLIEPLRLGLEKLRSEPEHFRTFNPSDGWGSYGLLCSFVAEYLAACERYPKAEVSVRR